MATRRETLREAVIRILVDPGDFAARLRGVESTVNDSSRRQAISIEEIRAAIKRLRNEQAGSSGAYEADAISKRQLIAINERLKRETLELAGAVGKGSNEYRQLTGIAGAASRTLATAEGRTSKLGLSAQVAAGTSARLSAALSAMGPAGAAAGSGLGFVSAQATAATGGLLGTTAAATALGAALLVAVPVVALGLLVRFADGAAKVADGIAEGAASVGLSAEAYQELRYALQQGGLQQEQFDQTMGQLNRRIGEAATGNKALGKTFKDLEIDIRDANGEVRSTEDIFLDAADRLAGFEDGSIAAAAAGDLFGDRIGRKMIPALEGGSEAIEGMRQRARDLGLVLSGDAILSLTQYGDEMDTLRQQFQTAGIEVTAAFIPVLRQGVIPLLQNGVIPALQKTAEWLNNVTERLTDNSEVGETFRAGMAANVAPLIAVGDTLLGVGNGFLSFYNLVLGVVAGTGAAIGRLSVQMEGLIRTSKNLAPIVALGLEGDQLIRQGKVVEGYQKIFGALGQLATVEVDLDFSAVDLNEVSRSADAAFAPYAQKALEYGQAAREHLLSVVTGGSVEKSNALLESLGAMLSAGGGALAGLGADAGTEYGNSFGEGLKSSDPSEAAREWTARLTSEVERGLKPAQEALGLLVPRIAELQATLATASASGDSKLYQDTLAKLEVLEGAVKAIIGDPTAAAREWTERLITEVDRGLKDRTGVGDILLGRQAELQQELVTAYQNQDVFGFGAALAKLEVIEAAADRILGKSVDIPVPRASARLNDPNLASFVASGFSEAQRVLLEEGRARADRDNLGIQNAPLAAQYGAGLSVPPSLSRDQLVALRTRNEQRVFAEGVIEDAQTQLRMVVLPAIRGFLGGVANTFENARAAIAEDQARAELFRVAQERYTTLPSDYPTAARLGAGETLDPVQRNPELYIGLSEQVQAQVQIQLETERRAAEARETVRGLLVDALSALRRGVSALWDVVEEAEEQRTESAAIAERSRETARFLGLVDNLRGGYGGLVSDSDLQDLTSRGGYMAGPTGNPADVVDAERAQQEAADRFASTVVSAGFAFADSVIQGIKEGDVGSVIGGLFGSASSVVGAGSFGALDLFGGSVPIAMLLSGGLGIIGSIIAALIPDPDRERPELSADLFGRGNRDINPLIGLSAPAASSAPVVSTVVLDAGNMMLESARIGRATAEYERETALMRRDSSGSGATARRRVR